MFDTATGIVGLRTASPDWAGAEQLKAEIWQLGQRAHPSHHRKQ